jgi:hypothetical protein
VPTPRHLFSRRFYLVCIRLVGCYHVSGMLLRPAVNLKALEIADHAAKPHADLIFETRVNLVSF